VEDKRILKERALAQYRVHTTITRPDRELVRAFQEYPAAAVSDALRKRQTLPFQIKSVHVPARRMVGPALTVLASAGDELLTLKAFELAQPGDVVVIAGAWNDQSSVLGGVMSWMAKVRGIAGIVTDGLVRDLEQITDSELPIHARGVTPLAPSHDVPPGDLNATVCIGQAVITPGDLVVADCDGVVVVPSGVLQKVRTTVDAIIARDDKWIRDLKETNSIDEILETCAVDALLSGGERVCSLK